MTDRCIYTDLNSSATSNTEKISRVAKMHWFIFSITWSFWSCWQNSCKHQLCGNSLLLIQLLLIHGDVNYWPTWQSCIRKHEQPESEWEVLFRVPPRGPRESEAIWHEIQQLITALHLLSNSLKKWTVEEVCLMPYSILKLLVKCVTEPSRSLALNLLISIGTRYVVFFFFF